MAKGKRDFLDEIIDIKEDWDALANPFGDLADSLTDAATGERKVFNPADYKEKPRVNSTRCVRCVLQNTGDICTYCVDVCPTNAIKFGNKTVSIDANCRKCGLCVAACPTEAVTTTKHLPRKLYDAIARAASAYEQAYVTCTRAIKRNPKGNEIVLPCLGVMSRDLWFALLTDYDNISVYLPLGICDKCRTTTGEAYFSDVIATAEEWSQGSLGLEVDRRDLTHELTRAYKRSQFVSGAITSAERLVSRGAPALAGAAAVAKKIQDHSRQLDRLTRTVEQAVGAKTTANKQRTLTSNRKLMLGAIQHDPEIVEFIYLEYPVADRSACTLCGDCVKICTLRAIDMSEAGVVRTEPQYCVNCGACMAACPEGALKLEPVDMSELVVPDEFTEEVRRKKEQAKAEADKLLAKGKGSLSKVADVIEKLDK